MTLTNKTHKAVLISFILLSVVAVLFLLRIALQLGMSAYMNAEAKDPNGNPSIISAYYDLQASTGDFMEPYIAYYNSGTALAKANQPDKAEKLLKTALEKVDNQHNECYVRNNLAKVQEQLGDAYMVSDMASTAQNYYSEAVKTISDAPASCFPPPPPTGGQGDKQDPNGNPLTPQDNSPTSQDAQNGKNMKDTEQRAKDKQDKAQAQGGDSANGENQVQQEMGEAQSNATNQQDTAKQQQSSGTQQSQNGKAQGQQQNTDKPW